MQRFADRVIEMRAERVDSNALAGDVLDALDRAVFQHVEDRLHLVIDAVRRIGGDELIAADDGVQHGGGGRTADLDIAGSKRDQRGRAAYRVADVLDGDPGPIEIAELLGEFMSRQAALARKVAQLHFVSGRRRCG